MSEWTDRARAALERTVSGARQLFAPKPAPASNQRTIAFMPATMTPKELSETWFGGEIPETEMYRRYFGRTVTPATIEQCIQSAAYGYMRDVTDLSYETLLLDPHLSTCVGKRMRAVANVKPQVIDATGEGIEPKKAAFYGDVVRQQIEWLPMPRQTWTRLAWGHYHGRSALEKVWKENVAGSKVKWRIDALHWLHPRRLAFGPSREIRIRDDLWGGTGFEARGFDVREVPEKFITFQPQLFNEYPEREGLAPRTLYWSFFKRFDWRERLILLEVFGKPWRIVEVDANAAVQADQLKLAQDTADKLGANASAAMPKGVHLNVAQPGEGAGQIHKDVAMECDDQMSKLVLGSTRTVDAKPDALGGDAARVHQDGEFLTFAGDCWNIGDVLTEQLAAHIIVMNFGAEELSHAPRIELPFEPKPDRTTEIDRTQKTISIGIPLKLEEVYERTGFTKPDPNDAVIQQVSGGGGGLLGPSGPTVQISDPDAPPKSPPGGGASPTGDDGGGTTPPALPPGPGETPPSPETPTASTNADITMPFAGYENFDACVLAQQAEGHDLETAKAICGKLQSEAETSARDGSKEPRIIRSTWAALDRSLQARQRFGDGVCCAAQPETVNGSPDVLIETGVREAARETAKWGSALVDAIGELEKPGEIFEALGRAAQDLPLAKFAAATERRVLHAVMLGALDSSWEIENEELIGLEAFAVGWHEKLLAKEFQPGDADKKFVSRPFDEAVKIFKERDVIGKDRFAQLTAAAKKRAFAVARLARQDLLEAAHAELGRQLQEATPNLKDFKKFVTERLETAGWTPANSSHVETIFRTNVVGAYSAGRHAQMTEPATIKARPFWQIFAVRDDRSRDAHKRAHGTVLPADHSFWQKAYAPFGYNCRCRIVSRGTNYTDRVTAVPSGLPDEGFESGTSRLLTSDL